MRALTARRSFHIRVRVLGSPTERAAQENGISRCYFALDKHFGDHCVLCIKVQCYIPFVVLAHNTQPPELNSEGKVSMSKHGQMVANHITVYDN